MDFDNEITISIHNASPNETTKTEDKSNWVVQYYIPSWVIYSIGFSAKYYYQPRIAIVSF